MNARPGRWRRLAATGMFLNRDCFTDGRPPARLKCELHLRWELGWPTCDVISCQGESKCTVTGAGAPLEARIRCTRQGREREGRRIYLQVDWEEDPEPRPAESGVRGLAGVLPPVRLATAWKTVEFVIERGQDGRPVAPRESGGLKLLHANENPNQWCNYSFEAGPDVIPEDVYPLLNVVCDITAEPNPERRAWYNVNRNGKKTYINANFRRGGELPQKLILRWPTAVREAELRFSLPEVPLPELRAPQVRELF